MRKGITKFVTACAVALGAVLCASLTNANAGQNSVNIQHAGSVDELEELMEAEGMPEASDVDSDYCAELAEKKDDSAHDAYRLRRIILYADSIHGDYGASSIICYDKYNYYILGFDTEEETERAYKQICKEYGDDRCMPDEILHTEDLLNEPEEGYMYYTQGSEGIDMESQGASLAEGDTYTAVSWGNSYMGMDILKSNVSLYDTAYTEVAILDSGVDETNAIFTGRINKEDSRNFCDADNPQNIGDEVGHGSHVAGIIADATPNQVKLTIMKCFSASSSSVSVIQRALMDAIDCDVDVINMSFCFYKKKTTWEKTVKLLDELIKEAADKNIVICVASGNATGAYEDRNVAGNSFLADREDVLTVSALAKRYYVDSNDNYLPVEGSRVDNSTVEFDDSYSFYGDAVDFTAPGTSIKSAYKGGTSHTMSGTSMASPHIAAAAAYVHMAEPELTRDEVKARLVEYCVDLGAVGKDVYYAYGCPYMADYLSDHGEKVKVKPGRCTLASTQNTKNGISVTWTEPGDIDPILMNGYEVCRKEAGDTEYKVIAKMNAAASSYVDKNVVSGRKYRYAVRALGTGGAGELGEGNVIYRLSEPKPAAANGLLGVVVSWDKIQGAEKYRVYRKNAGSSSWKLLVTVDSGVETYKDTTVKDGMSYVYTVKAYRAGCWSSYDGAGADIYRLRTCSIVSVTSPAKRRVDVRWNRTAETSGYLIQYSDTRSYAKHKDIMVDVNSGSVINKSVIVGNAGAVYYFRMRSYKKIGGKIYYGGWTASRKIKSLSEVR